MKLSSAAVGAVLIVSLAAGPALAHPGHGELGFMAGIVHPFSGLDHMLAMVAVGLLAAISRGKAIIIWPVGFVCAMLTGYGWGLVHPGIALIEPMILASVILLGGFIAMMVRMPVVVGLSLIVVFGLAHGYAHGAEAPPGGGLAFPLGFAIATAVLHAIGVSLAILAQRIERPRLVRVLGGAVALGGFALAIAA